MRTQCLFTGILFIIQCMRHMRSEMNLNFLKIFRKFSAHVVYT